MKECYAVCIIWNMNWISNMNTPTYLTTNYIFALYGYKNENVIRYDIIKFPNEINLFINFVGIFVSRLAFQISRLLLPSSSLSNTKIERRKQNWNFEFSTMGLHFY